MATPNELVLNTEAAAAHVGLAASTLTKMRVSGAGPAFIKLGHRVVYRKDDLNDWLDANRRTSTSDNGSRGNVDQAPHSDISGEHHER